MAVSVPVGLELRLLLMMRPSLSTCTKFLASTHRALSYCRFFPRSCCPVYTQGLPDPSSYYNLVCQYDKDPESTTPAPHQKVNMMKDAVETMTSRLSSKDLLDRCDGFPYANREPERYAKKMSELYTIIWEDEQGPFPIGYMLSSVFEELKRVPANVRGDIVFNPYDRTIKIFHKPITEQKRTELVAATTHYLRVNTHLKIIKGWRNELWPIYGRSGDPLFSMERAAVALFGYMRYGVHLIAYTPCPTAPHGIKIWVPKRSQMKTSWPGSFDSTVAGGLMTDEHPFDCVIREADEEASLPEHLVRKHAKLAGTVKYIFVGESRPGAGDGYVYPECQWVYDLELSEDVICEPNDGEVESFGLCTVDEVREQLTAGRWKPNCAVIVLDFFVRRGILTPDNEPYFEEIETRLRREMPFPGPHNFEDD